MEVAYAIVKAKYKCPKCSAFLEDYADKKIFADGMVVTCYDCEEKFKVKAMK
jgi:DNA-directed RNA polymerase subunit RPC12/RpoP